MKTVIDYAFGISAVDSDYIRPTLDAIHIVIEGKRAAVIDAGANHSVPRVIAALASTAVSEPLNLSGATRIFMAKGAGSFGGRPGGDKPLARLHPPARRSRKKLWSRPAHSSWRTPLVTSHR